MREFQIKNKNDLLINVIEPEYKSANSPKGFVIHLHGICSHFQKFMNYPELLDSLHAKNKYFNSLDLKTFAIEFMDTVKVREPDAILIILMIY